MNWKTELRKLHRLYHREQMANTKEQIGNMKARLRKSADTKSGCHDA